MFPVLRQRPAKMANSPLSEFNGLYIYAAMWLHDDEHSEHVFRIPRHVAGGYFRPSASMRPPLSLALVALFEMKTSEDMM